MKIDSARLWSYGLPLKRPLPTAGEEARTRDGLIIEFGSQDGDFGLGEIAPLPGYSAETLSDAQTETEAAIWHLKGSDIPPNLEELSGGFAAWLGKIARLPSVRFGIESAILNLLAASQKLTLAELIADQPSLYIYVNGLLSGSSHKVLERADEFAASGCRALKLKVGRLELEEEIELVRQVRARISADVALRLDANGRFSLDDAIKFGHAVADCHIEYIEEPVSGLSDLGQLLNQGSFPVPVALDESLASMEPSELADWDRVHAVVIKPTRLGLERAMMFARFASARGMKAVVSSTFESGVSILTLINFAAALNLGDVPVGLDTLDWFEADLLARPLGIDAGPVDLNRIPRTVAIDSLNPDLIREVHRA